jgi:hypothetical protein
MYRIYYYVLTVFITICPSASKAATVVYNSSDNVIGIIDLVVGSERYNVNFETGTMETLFGYDYTSNSFTNPPHFWGEGQGKASEAVAAINSVLNAESIDAPTIVDGYPNYEIPYAGQLDQSDRDAIYSGRGHRTYVTNHYEYEAQVSAIWSNALHHYANFSVIPIPGAFWLLGSGLVILVGLRRKLMK